jgi:tryptophan 2,3-dioxygenase
MPEKMTYASYLHLDEVLAAQHPRSHEHDEMLFIVIHQVYELWFKQLLHELAQLRRHLRAGDTTHSIRTTRRILSILKIIVAQLDVLETMTPMQFSTFRDALGTSSGFQSAQFREIEHVLGSEVFADYVAYLTTQGYAGETEQILKQVYDDDAGPAVVAELLVDMDEGMQEWRYRHVKMVERTIGARTGTGGSTGAAYLAGTVGKTFFPDLWAVRNLG